MSSPVWSQAENCEIQGFRGHWLITIHTSECPSLQES